MRQILVFFILITLAGCGNKESETFTSNKSQKFSEQPTYLLFVKIPESVMPIERGEKYEDPLNNFLVTESLGEVTGGGSSLSHPDSNGKRSIEWVGVDVEVYDPEKALPLVIKKLKEIGVPEGTKIEQYKPIKKTITVR